MDSPFCIPKSDAQLVLNTLSKLPPEEVIERFHSEDQLDFWLRDKEQYQILLDELKAYFEGREVQLLGLSDEEQNLYRAKRDYYLALYALFREAWTEIKNFSEVFSGVLLAVMHQILDEKCRNNQQIKDFFIEMFRLATQQYPFESPGQLLSAILENDSRARLIRVLSGRYDINFRKLYRLNLEFKKKRKTGASIDDLRKIVRKAQRACGWFRPEMKKCVQLEQFCLCICWIVSGKNKHIRGKYDKYEEAKMELNELLFLIFRDQNSVAWENGRRYGFNQEGGTPVK